MSKLLLKGLKMNGIVYLKEILWGYLKWQNIIIGVKKEENYKNGGKWICFPLMGKYIQK